MEDIIVPVLKASVPVLIPAKIDEYACFNDKKGEEQESIVSQGNQPEMLEEREIKANASDKSKIPKQKKRH